MPVESKVCAGSTKFPITMVHTSQGGGNSFALGKVLVEAANSIVTKDRGKHPEKHPHPAGCGISMDCLNLKLRAVGDIRYILPPR
jgi:hypothetical protein